MQMTRSMTAFAHQKARLDMGVLSWEIRSVNHRHLDLVMRLPKTLRMLEPLARDTVRAQIHRGKVECQLHFQSSPQSQQIEINTVLVEQLTQATHKIGTLSAPLASINPLELMQWPGVLTEPPLDLDALQGTAMTLFKKTLDELLEHRKREGQQLEQLIQQRLTAIDAIVAIQHEHRPDILKAWQQKIHQRLTGLHNELDPHRLEQEITLLASKSDVAEELDRLSTHTNEVRHTMKQAGPIGRRLDFLMQELNREANTLSSKSLSTATSLDAVELKVLIEQIREQVQNIE
jgi:uncharacterized protein (TIGR00255 family)